MAARVTAAKKAAPARPAARRQNLAPAPAPLEEPSANGFEVLRLSSNPKRAEERVPLFYIDDVEYSVAKRPGVNVGLQFMHLYRTEGEQSAVDYLLGKLLGDDGYRALREYDDLTAEQFQQICEIATKLTLGAMELPKE